MTTITVREGSQATLFFPLTDATGQGADLAGKRVELILVDKDQNREESRVISNVEGSVYGRLSVGARNHRQVLTAVGGSGTFQLQYGGSTTAVLSSTASAAQVQAALASIVGADNVVCQGGPLGTAAVLIEFVGSLFEQAQPLLVPINVSEGLTVTVVGQTVVYFTPAPRTFWAELSPYKAYFRVIDAVGTILTYPEDGEYFIEIVVQPGYVLR